MSNNRALILLKMDPPPGRETEWNDWYDTEHIPGRLAIPGFLAIRRFANTDGMPEGWGVPAPKYLTLYELADVQVPSSEPYLKLRDKEVGAPSDSFAATTRSLPNLSGGVYEQILPEENTYEVPRDTRYLLAVGHADIPPEIEEEYNAWYNTEHIPSYVEIPGFLHARRFRRVQGSPEALPGAAISGADYAALYDLANGQVFETPEFKQRSVTPWSTRIRGFTWSRRKMNNLYRSMDG